MRNVNFDWVEPGRVMRIRIDQDQVRQLGLSSQDVALALNGVVTGSYLSRKVRGLVFGSSLALAAALSGTKLNAGN